MYASLDPEVATVTEGGLVTLVGPGETTITAIAVSEEGLASPVAALKYTITGVIEEATFEDSAMSLAIRELIKAGESYMKSDGITWPLFYTMVYYLLFVGLLTLLFNWLEKKLDYFK